MATNMNGIKRTEKIPRRLGVPGLIAICIALIAVSGPVNAYAEVGHIDIPVYGEFWGPDWISLWQPDTEVFVHGGPPNPALGMGSFGFFFSTDPGTLITIFGPNDLGGSGAYPYNDAQIDFSTGKVIDLDAGGVTESTFTNLGSSIGFWISLDLDHNPETPPNMAYTYFDPNVINPNLLIGTAATFTSHDYPSTYLLYFYSPEAAEFPFAGEIVAGITPVPVPEPATILLLGSGWVVFAVYGRQRFLKK